MTSPTDSPTDSSTVLETTSAPIKRAIILVCENCGRKLVAAGGSPNPAIQLQQEMKLEIKERFGKGVVRAVSTSCLDICPQGRVAVGIANAHSDKSTANLEFFTVAPEDLAVAKDELLGRFSK